MCSILDMSKILPQKSYVRHLELLALNFDVRIAAILDVYGQNGDFEAMKDGFVSLAKQAAEMEKHHRMMEQGDREMDDETGQLESFGEDDSAHGGRMPDDASS